MADLLHYRARQSRRDRIGNRAHEEVHVVHETRARELRPIIRFLATIFITIILSGVTRLAGAQQLSLSGTVSDSTGVIPGASVTLTNTGRQVATQTTDGVGAYRFTGLSTGTYELTVSMRGYDTLVRTVVLAPDTPALDLVLGVGRVSTQLSVTASERRMTATRVDVPNDQAPAQVSAIPQELLQQEGVNSVAGALKNASGVQAFRWYGAYEQYTIRGFNDDDRDGLNVVLVDGMHLGGNRYNTQTNNVQSIEVLKGPSSVLYGRGAVGGVINILRKQPQAARASEFSYQAGRFNTQQIAAGTTGAIDTNSRWLYRVDVSFEHADGWRAAGADRLNVSPSLTWVISDRTRLSVFQTFNRDRFDGDGGVPLNILSLPSYRPNLRLSLPQDNVLVEDSQTQAVFQTRLTARWEFRNSLQLQRTSDRYFVTEGVYGDPDNDEVFREPLDFHHIRRPIQEQAELIGHVGGTVRHTILAGYEFLRDKYRTEVSAGDDPDCVCGYWWITIAPMDITTLTETQGPLDITTVARTTFVNDRTHAAYVQDQIDVTPKLKLNIGGRLDGYHRNVDRVGGLPFTPQERRQNALTYRAGAVYDLQPGQQIYGAVSSAFTPVTDIPEDGSELEPSTAQNVEVGHRWRGLNGRIDTSAALYFIVRNHLAIRESPNTVEQIGEQTARGLDVDVNADLGRGTHLLVNYGATRARLDDAEDLTGLRPRFVPAQTANLWARKDWSSGLNAALGLRVVGSQFVTDDNTSKVDGYAIVSAAVGYHMKRWDWTLHADNLFNKKDYFLPGHFSNQVFPGQPINVSVAIRLKY